MTELIRGKNVVVEGRHWTHDLMEKKAPGLGLKDLTQRS